MAARAQLAPDKACLVAKLTPRKSATCFPSPPAPKTLSPSALGGVQSGRRSENRQPPASRLLFFTTHSRSPALDCGRRRFMGRYFANRSALMKFGKGSRVFNGLPHPVGLDEIGSVPLLIPRLYWQATGPELDQAAAIAPISPSLSVPIGGGK